MVSLGHDERSGRSQSASEVHRREEISEKSTNPRKVKRDELLTTYQILFFNSEIKVRGYPIQHSVILYSVNEE